MTASDDLSVREVVDAPPPPFAGPDVGPAPPLIPGGGTADMADPSVTEAPGRAEATGTDTPGAYGLPFAWARDNAPPSDDGEPVDGDGERPPDRAGRPRRRRRLVVGLGLVVAAAVVVPVLSLGGSLIRQTVDADKGGSFPSIAINGFMNAAYNPWGRDKDDIGLDRWICTAHKRKVMEQIRTVRAEIDAETKAFPGDPGKFEEDWSRHSEQVDGKTATVTAEFRVVRDVNDPDTHQSYSMPSEYATWTFQLAQEGNAGWKVCDQKAPRRCDAYVHCVNGTPTPYTKPSATPTPSATSSAPPNGGDDGVIKPPDECHSIVTGEVFRWCQTPTPTPR